MRVMRVLLGATAFIARPPKGGTARAVRYGQRVRGRLVTARNADPANGILLWIHGGGLISGSPRLDQGLAGLYSERSGLPVFVPRYRLAPEHPFPAAADDVLDAYIALLHQGYPADRIRVGGISAGGVLVTGLLGDLGRGGLPMPAGALLVSALLDLSAESARRCDAANPDPCCSPAFIERTSKAYTGDTPLSHPRLEVLGTDMRDWPPVLVQVGSTECVVGEAKQLGAAMRAAGGSCEVQIWPGQVHGFVGLGAKTVPEARAALDYGAEFLSACAAGSRR